jgi:plasmid stabilization system protein ParE
MLVRWTKPAVDDFTHICDYTEEHFGPAQARRAALSIYESVEFLRRFLTMGGRAASPTPASSTSKNCLL